MTNSAVGTRDTPRLTSPSGTVVFALKGLVLPYLFLSLLFFGLVQIQHALFGRVFLLHQHLRLAGLLGTLAASVAYVFQRSRLRIEQPRLVVFVIVYAAYLVLDFLAKWTTGQVALPALIYAETYLYFYAFFLLVILVLVSNVATGPVVRVERDAFRQLYLWAVPVFALGYVQFLLNKPLLTVSDESGYVVEAYIPTAISHVRAFSVFGSGFAYGHFAVLVGSLATSALLTGRARVRRRFIGLLLAATMAVVTTLTRTSYLELVFTLSGVLFIRWAIQRDWNGWRIIGASILLGSATYGGILAFFFAARGMARGILDVGTFGIRLLGVAGVVRRFFLDLSAPGPILFGHGYIQGPKFAELQGIRTLIFDNTYVDIALFSGVVGLVLYLVFFLLLFAHVVRKYRQTGSYWWLALAGMYFSYPLVAAINIYVSILYLITCLVLAYDALSKRGVVGLQASP